MSGMPRRWQVTDVILGASVLLVIALLPPFTSRAPWHGLFSTTLISLIGTALPWLVLGAVLGGAIQAFLSDSLLPTMARRMGVLGIPGIAVLSAAVPVCECGSVAVARGLISKGLPVPHAVAYLLAGPIVNPTVLAATWVAFSDWRYAALRACCGLAIAIGIGCVVARSRQWWMRPGVVPEPAPLRITLVGATALAAHGRSTASPRPSATPHAIMTPRAMTPGARPLPRWRIWTLTSFEHFIDMAGWYAFGCVLASGVLTAIQVHSIDVVRYAGDPVIGPAAMSGAAFALSICAESDAFVAAALSNGGSTIGMAGIMAFLVSGPMIDLKLLMMYQTIFRVRAVLALVALICLGVAGCVAAITWLGIAT